MTLSFNSFFDELFYINLDRVTERREHCEREFKKHGLVVRRWSATEGTSLDPRSYSPLDANNAGCFYTHLDVIRHAQKEKLKNVCVFEDDVVFDEDLQKRFAECIVEVPSDWDFILFGGLTHFSAKYAFLKEPKPEQISPHVYKISAAFCMHSYAVNNTAYELMLSLFPRMVEGEPIDTLMSNEIYRNSNAYMIRPVMAWQKTGYSYIKESHQNYFNLRK